MCYNCPTIFSTVTCCTGLQPISNRLYHIDSVCSRLYYLVLCKYTVWRSHNDEIAWRRVCQNVSPSLSDVRLYRVIRELCVCVCVCVCVFLQRSNVISCRLMQTNKTQICYILFNISKCPHSDVPGCTMHVDIILYMYMYWLQLSYLRWVCGFETCTCRRYCEKKKIKFNKGALFFGLP